MNKTKIEWCDYTWNPIKGYCPNNCSYCYAHRMYDRFGWDKTIRLDEKELGVPVKLKKPSCIFVGSMIDLYHPKIDTSWVDQIILASQRAPRHTYITLTKCPHNLRTYRFPEHWWVGVSMDNVWYNRDITLRGLTNVQGKKFISFEPLLAPMFAVPLDGIDWVIIGGLTPKPLHERVWIDDIVRRANAQGIPVFIKDNAHYPVVRRDFP